MIIVSAQAFPPRKGGIQSLLFGAAQAMCNAGHDVKVFADGNKQAGQWDKEQNHPFIIQRFSGWKPIRQRVKSLHIKKATTQHDVKAIYFDTWKSLENLKGDFDIPLIVWTHGNDVNDMGKRQGRIKAALTRADKIICVSSHTYNTVANILGSDEKLALIHPSPNPIQTPTAEENANTEQAWQTTQPRLVSFCRLIDWKGIDHALKALPEVIQHYPEARFLIGGEGDDKTRLEEIIRDLNLSQSIEFIGWVSETQKSAFLSSADIFLQPGRDVKGEKEGYGISYAEAALHGLPSIAGNAGGAPDAVVEGKTGFVVDATNPQNISAAILKILSDPNLHKSMRENCTSYGKTCLWDHKINEILALAGLEKQI